MEDAMRATASDLDVAPTVQPAPKPEAVHTYSFYQLVELLHRLEGNDPDSEEWEKLGKLLFTSNPSLGFAASEVQALKRIKGGRLQLDTRFFGLNGAQSPLPSYMLDQITDINNENVRQHFLDFFSHRLISILYRIWRKYRYYVRFKENAEDSFSRQFYSLVGLGSEELRNDASLNWCKMLSYAGMLAGRSRSPQAVSGIIAHYFDLGNVSVRQWVYRRVEIAPEQRTALGVRNSDVAMNAIVGDSVGDVMSKFVLCIGDLSLDRYKDFLPSGREFESLEKVIEVIMREQMAFDLELTMNVEEKPALELGSKAGGLLGWTSFLSNTDQAVGVLIQVRS